MSNNKGYDMHDKRQTERIETGKYDYKHNHKKAKSCAYCGKPTTTLTEPDELYFHCTTCFYAYVAKHGVPLKYKRSYD